MKQLRQTLLLFLLLIISLQAIASIQPLPAKQVFQLSAKVHDPNSVQLNWSILPGYFLYKNRFSFSIDDKKNAEIGTISNFSSFSKDNHVESKSDVLGTYRIYRKQADFTIPILAKIPGKIILQANYQGCADSGFCYPPMSDYFELKIDQNKAITSITPIDKIMTPPDTSGLTRITRLLNGHSLPLIMLSFFGLGLLLAFTPCLLPMLPILSGIIVGHGKNITSAKGFLLSLTYVLSMACTYTFIGILFAMIGGNLQASFQQPWVIALYAALFIALSLSMFGFYDLSIPTALQARFAALSHRQTSGTYLGVAIMGCLSTLILSPCVTAPLVGVLGFIAKSGNIVLGATALFAMSLGMGTPLLLVGISGGKLLPKAGIWMNTVKALFGVMLLAVAINLLDRIVAPQITMVLWSALFIVTAVYLGAFETSHQTQLSKFWQGLGLLLLVYGILLTIGAGLGNTDMFRPLEGLTINSHTAKAPSFSKPLTQLAEVETAIHKAHGKPVFLDFYADWCISCKKMEKEVFTDNKVKELLKKFVVLRIDLTKQTADSDLLSRHFGIIAPPTFLFIDNDGKLQTSYSLVGELSAHDFAKHLQQFLQTNNTDNSAHTVDI